MQRQHLRTVGPHEREVVGMIPAAPGTVALYGPDPGQTQPRRVAVVAWSDEPLCAPMVCNGSQLVPAQHHPLAAKRGFHGIDVPSVQIVAVRGAKQPVEVAVMGGTDTAIGWAFASDGTTHPVLDDHGTPWVDLNGWEPIKPALREVG